jgi:uncharacterized protein (TIGR03067 family)
MYRVVTIVATIIVLRSMVSAQDANRPADFEGRWVAVELETDGEKQDVKVTKSFRVRVVGDRIDFRPSGTILRQTKFKLDPTKSPKTIELTIVDDDRLGRTVHGIYRVEKGRWTMCVPNFDSDVKTASAPSEFKTRPGDGLVLMTLVRVTQK